MMFTIRRLLHSTNPLKFHLNSALNQSNLSRLRKNTGYPMSLCRTALEKFNNDVDEATKWLNEQAQKEGWAKAEKLKDRKVTQGIIAFLRSHKKTALIELNCETDFVAQNEKFHALASLITDSVLNNVTTTKKKETILKNDLRNIKSLSDPSRTLADELALGIANLGENIVLRRAIKFDAANDEHLGWYVHGSGNEGPAVTKYGKYAAVVCLKMAETPDGYKPFDIGRQLAQHIVGMKPQSIGEVKADNNDLNSSNETDTKTTQIDENETRLLYQEFLMMPGIRILDFLKQNNAEVVDFVRIECGEPIEGEQS